MYVDHNRLNDVKTVGEAIEVLSEGNPGAAHVLSESYKLAQERGMGDESGMFFSILDTLRVYGSNIWVLFTDCLEQDVDNFCLFLFQVALIDKYTAEQVHEFIKDEKPIEFNRMAAVLELAEHQNGEM
jgi:hypothetical protein